MFFWNSHAFLMFQWMLAIWSLVLPFLNPTWTSGSSRFVYCWSLAWRILSITLLACDLSAIVRLFEYSLALSFFVIGMKTNLFLSCGLCCIFQSCWHIEWSTFTESSFRIWNSSTGISSCPLALGVDGDFQYHPSDLGGGERELEIELVVNGQGFHQSS